MKRCPDCGRRHIIGVVDNGQSTEVRGEFDCGDQFSASACCHAEMARQWDAIDV